MTTFYPALRYRDAHVAIDWLERAFGFEREVVYDDDSGGVAHAQLRFGDGLVMVGTDREDSDAGRRAGLGWTYVALEGDVDAHFERARDAGAEILKEPYDQDYGSRDYSARDPEGNVWNFGTYRP